MAGMPILAGETDPARELSGGRKTVPTPGTAVALTVSNNTKGVVVQALPTNNALVWVGGEDVSGVVGSEVGISLLPGQTFSVGIANSGIIYIDAVTAGNGVSYLLSK